MESNKLLIGVKFHDEQRGDVDIELITLRDITLGQLLNGIKYGLMKKGASDFANFCIEVYNECINYDETSLVYRKITLTSYNALYLTGKIIDNRVELNINDLNKKLYELGFITSTKIVFDMTGLYRSYEVNDARNVITAFNPLNKNPNDDSMIIFPDYNISTRQLYKFDMTPVEIVQPTDPPQKQGDNLFLTLLPSALMLGSMVLARTLISGGGASGISMVVMSGVMGVATMVTSIISWVRQRKEFKRKLESWREHYQSYIAKTISKIQIRKTQDIRMMLSLYPDVIDILGNGNASESVFNVSGKIFSRSYEDSDFLSVRLGLSNDVDTCFEIKGSAKETVFSEANFSFANDSVKIYIDSDPEYASADNEEHYLCNLPDFINKRYKKLQNAPLLFSLKNCGALGIVYGQQYHDSSVMLIERMIFELCFYHTPEDLQFVMLFPRTEDPRKIEESINAYKFLPHFRGLFSDRSQFIFNINDASAVFSNMLNIMAERSEGSKQPHIVFVVMDEYDMKKHAFAQYLPKLPEDGKPYENALGLTFIFSKPFKEYLPRYCTDVINITGSSSELVPHDDKKEAKKFVYSITKEWKSRLYNSYKILSALSYAKITQNGKVPSNVSLFELFGLEKGKIDVAGLWGLSGGKRDCDIIESLAVPIGKTDIGITTLDLHEKSDGAHMLVAGTTGSGKSETIISYLLGLCLRFRPDEVNLMLVDMKGGGFIKRIGMLPHVVGSVTDVDGDESGVGAEYMLKRFLNALASEIRRRKILFNSMYVDNINAYITACRDINSHIETVSKRLAGEGRDPLSDEEKAKIRKQADEDALTHLVLVVDEFTELKRFSTENNDIDFIGEITTIARVGRSLGFHIILISQNIEGAITDDIRVNSRSRLCLKVATKQASKEMIGNDLAASPSMPGFGRAYLQVGNGSKFEYFQSAYSGATVEEQMELPVEIVEASKTGAYTVFYRSEKDNTEYKARKEELKRQGRLETQLNAVVSAIKSCYDAKRSEIKKVHIVFRKPLPDRIVYNSGRILEYKDGKFEQMEVI